MSLLMGAYEGAIRHFLGIADESMSAPSRERLAQARELDLVALDGIVGVKPEADNKKDFQAHTVPRLARDSLTGSAIALYHTLMHPYALDCEDSDVSYLVNHAYFGRLLRETASGEGVIDLEHHGRLQTLPGLFAHAVKAFFAPGRETDPYRLDRIQIGPHTVTRDHKNWRLAKIHLLAGMDNETLFADHAVAHLNNNAIEAATKRLLPLRHPVRLFLGPHFGVCIPLDELIMELFYRHSSPGNPFGFPARSIFDLVNKGLADDRERGLDPRYADTPFNRAMRESYAVVHEHAARFVDASIQVGSPEFAALRQWSDELRQSMPYFPSHDALDLDSLKTILARFIYEGSFMSSTDHVVTRDALGYFKSIFRVRKPFQEDASYEMSDLFHRIDTYQRIVFRSVFSGAHCEAPLRDVHYDAALKVDLERFKTGLRGLESKYPALFPLDRVASSIDI